MRIVSLILIVLTTSSAVRAAAPEGSPPVHVLSSSPNGVSRVYGNIRLMSTSAETLYIYNGVTDTKQVMVRAPFRYRPEITWYGNTCVRVMVGTGSPGRYSVFYDLPANAKSPELWFVIVYDPKRKIALLGGERLELVSVFSGRRVLAITPADLPTTAFTFLVVEHAEFDRDGDLRIEYRNTSGGKSKLVVTSDEIAARLNKQKDRALR